MPEKDFWIEFIGDRSARIFKDQTILQASLASGIPHYHDCGGQARCSTCRILVQTGIDQLSSVNEKEAALRKELPFPENVRLACQTYVIGQPVTVHRIIRDETDIAMYIEEDWRPDQQHIGEEKELALFFLDIRNFTPFIQAYLPFDVIHVMRRLFALFRNCIEDHQGKIIDTAGDGLYAVFGFDKTPDEAVQDGMETGWSIEAELEKFNHQYLLRHFSHSFEIGIGLHVGRVIVGNIGIGVNNNLTVMGLPVNIASRLQSSTKELDNNFIISDTAYALLKNPPVAEKRELKLKGLKEKIIVRLMGKKFSATSYSSGPY